MKKVLFAALAIIAMFASIAAAPMPASVTLVGVSNGGGGPMFTFRVDGPVNLNNGIVHSVVGEYQGDFPLYCKQENETTVICHASKKISGDSVTVEFGGNRFWVGIPETPNPYVESSYCYNAYALQSYSSENSVEPSRAYHWGEFGTVCQDTPAEELDQVIFEGFFGDTPFTFYENGIDIPFIPNPGQGYYMDAF